MTINRRKYYSHTRKYEISIGILSICSFFQYCVRNILLFSIDTHKVLRSSNFAIAKVVALNLVCTLKVFFLLELMATFLYCFPYNYRSVNYCDSWKSDNYRKLTMTIKSYTRSNRENSDIAITILEK